MFPLWLTIVIILFFVWQLWKLINVFHYYDYVTITHLIPLYHAYQQKNNRILYHQSYYLIRKPIITFKNPDAYQNYKCLGTAFFVQSSRYVSNEQPCLKPTGLYDDLLLSSSLFHFFFILSAPFHSV